MSIDVWMEIDTGNPEGPSPITEWFNHTSNCGEMWQLALGGNGITDLKGMQGSDADPILRSAIIKMSGRPQDYKHLEPENGWGSFESALNFLVKIRELCILHPLATIGMSY